MMQENENCTTALLEYIHLNKNFALIIVFM